VLPVEMPRLDCLSSGPPATREW